MEGKDIFWQPIKLVNEDTKMMEDLNKGYDYERYTMQEHQGTYLFRITDVDGTLLTSTFVDGNAYSGTWRINQIISAVKGAEFLAMKSVITENYAQEVGLYLASKSDNIHPWSDLDDIIENPTWGMLIIKLTQDIKGKPNPLMIYQEDKTMYAVDEINNAKQYIGGLLIGGLPEGAKVVYKSPDYKIREQHRQGEILSKYVDGQHGW